MNSRAWTETATGADAKSVRRWARRAATPILVRYLMLLTLVVGVGFHLYVILSAALLSDPVCTGLCEEQPSRNLDWDFSDLIPF